jgi:hypothetical protein
LGLGVNAVPGIADQFKFGGIDIVQIEPDQQIEINAGDNHANPVKIRHGLKFQGKVKKSLQDIVLLVTELVRAIIGGLFPDPLQNILQIRAQFICFNHVFRTLKKQIKEPRRNYPLPSRPCRHDARRPGIFNAPIII